MHVPLGIVRFLPANGSDSTFYHHPLFVQNLHPPFRHVILNFLEGQLPPVSLIWISRNKNHLPTAVRVVDLLTIAAGFQDRRSLPDAVGGRAARLPERRAAAARPVGRHGSLLDPRHLLPEREVGARTQRDPAEQEHEDLPERNGALQREVGS